MAGLVDDGPQRSGLAAGVAEQSLQGDGEKAVDTLADQLMARLSELICRALVSGQDAAAIIESQ